MRSRLVRSRSPWPGNPYSPRVAGLHAHRKAETAVHIPRTASDEGLESLTARMRTRHHFRGLTKMIGTIFVASRKWSEI